MDELNASVCSAERVTVRNQPIVSGCDAIEGASVVREATRVQGYRRGRLPAPSVPRGRFAVLGAARLRFRVRRSGMSRTGMLPAPLRRAIDDTGAP